MKKILFIVILLIITAACSNDHKIEGYADEEPMLSVWQTNISKNRLWADNLGFIEDDSVEIRALVEKLRIQAKANDTLVVSCLTLSDAAQDTVVGLYGIK